MANVAEVAVALCGRPRYPTLAAIERGNGEEEESYDTVD
jgi:hypothetical protein